MEGSEVRGKGYFCLHFAHCHNGYHIGVLRVYDRVGNGPRQTWWSLARDFGPKWHTAAVQLDLTSVREVGVIDARYMTCISSGKSTSLIRGTHPTHARTCAHAHTHTQTLTHTHIHTHRRTRPYACTPAYTSTYACTYTRTHTHT